MMQKHLRLSLLLSALLLLCLLSGCSRDAAPAPQTQDAPSAQSTAPAAAAPTAEITAEPTAEPTTEPQSSALTLTLGSDLFLAGKQAILTLNVACSSQLTADVSILDETGTLIAVLRNNASGSLRTQIPFRRSAIGEGSLTAVCGDVKSAPVPYSVQPEVTDQMISTLYDLSGELGSFAVSCAFEDPYSAEALAKVKDFLTNHAQVSEVRENNGVLLYRTSDGLIGSYGLGRETEGYAGYTPAEDVYTDWKNGKSVADALIQSDIALTRDRCIILCPDSKHDIAMHSQCISSRFIMQNVFPVTDLYEDNDAHMHLGDGSFTDCGMLVFDAHGAVLKRPDGSNFLLIKTGQFTNKDECISYLHSINPQFLYKRPFFADSTCTAVLDTSLTKSGIHTSMFLSTLFFEHVLKGRSFDNTVIFFATCHAFSDTYLLDLLFKHGASMVIGCHKAAMLNYSTLVLFEIQRALITQKDNISYGTFIDGVSSVTQDSIDSYFRFTGEVSEENLQLAKMHVLGNLANPNPNDANTTAVYDAYKAIYDAYHKNMDNDAFFSYALRDEENRLRTYQGECRLKGHVLTDDGLPANGAMVTAYRWLDHSWQEYEHKCVVNAHGEYNFSALPYGVYALEASMRGMSGHMILEVNAASMLTEPIILKGGVVIWGETQYHPAQVESGKDNYESLTVFPKLLKAPDDALKQKLEEHLANHRAVIGDQISMLATTPAGSENAGSYATSYITRAYSAGDVLSLQLKSVACMNDAQRPWHGDGSLNIALDTGEFLSPDHLLIDFDRAPNLRAGIMALLDRFSDSDLPASREVLCERTLRGELGGWALTPDGLEISYSTYDFGRYAAVGSAIIPYDILAGEIKEMYLPDTQQNAPQEEAAVRAVPDTDPRFSDNSYQIWGEATGRAMAFDGSAEHVTIFACDPGDPQKTTSIVFYASGLCNALIHLPVHDGSLYRIDWQHGAVHSSTMVEYP